MTGRSILVALRRRLFPGFDHVHSQVEPFARAWRAANAEALLQDGALWVALGDSMSQGIGAQDISGGWVGQLHSQLMADGRQIRLVNLSVTGARVRDVLTDQLPRLRELGSDPALVTVLVGANDMLFRSRRAAAVDYFARLIDEVPQRVTVIGTLPRRNPQALAINTLIDDAANAGRVRVADMRGRNLASLRGTRADDHFHPNERGYATVAKEFAAAIGLDPPRT